MTKEDDYVKKNGQGNYFQRSNNVNRDIFVIFSYPHNGSNSITKSLIMKL